MIVYFWRNVDTIFYQIVGSLLSFAFVTMVSRTLSVTEFGIWTEYRALVDFLSAIILMSIPQYVIFKSKTLYQGKLIVFTWAAVAVGAIAVMTLLNFTSLIVGCALSATILFGLGRPLLLINESKLFGISSGLAWLICTLFLLAHPTGYAHVVLVYYAIGLGAVGCIGVIVHLKASRTMSLGHVFEEKVNTTKEFVLYNLVFYFANASQNFLYWYLVRQIKETASLVEVGYLGIANTLVFSMFLLPTNYLSPLAMKQIAAKKEMPPKKAPAVFVAATSTLIILGLVMFPKFIPFIWGVKAQLAGNTILIMSGFLPFFFWDRVQLVICQGLGYKLPMLCGSFLRLFTVLLGCYFFKQTIDSKIAGFILGVGFVIGVVGTELILSSRTYKAEAL